MHQEYLSKLREQLLRKVSRLEDASFKFFVAKLKRFWHFVKADQTLSVILDQLRKDGLARTTANQIYNSIDDSVHNSALKQALYGIETEEGMAAIAVIIIDEICDDTWDATRLDKALWRPEAESKGQFKYFKREIINAIVDWICEVIDDRSILLGMLARYKQRSEWFNKTGLNRIAEEEQARADEAKLEKVRRETAGNPEKVSGTQARIEDVLKVDLYRYLHDQGITFSIEQKGERGEIDLILSQAEKGRHYIEGKVFDNAGRGVDNVIAGTHQLLDYLAQYNATTGYLLVYNISPKRLRFPGCEELGTIPYIRCNHKTVYLLEVDIYQSRKSPSTENHEYVDIQAERLMKTTSPVCEPGGD